MTIVMYCAMGGIVAGGWPVVWSRNQRKFFHFFDQPWSMYVCSSKLKLFCYSCEKLAQLEGHQREEKTEECLMVAVGNFSHCFLVETHQRFPKEQQDVSRSQGITRCSLSLSLLFSLPSYQEISFFSLSVSMCVCVCVFSFPSMSFHRS